MKYKKMPMFVYMQQIEIPEHVNKGFLARSLYPEMKEKSARAKFHNKLNGWCRMKFSEAEIKKIKEMLK
jgi:hypothetical protein